MAKKKSDQAETSEEQRELERRVDAMMSVETPKAAAAPQASAPKPAKLAKESGIGTADAPDDDDQPTAPQLPSQLLKTIGATRSKTKKTAKLKAADKTAAAPPDDPDDPPPERILKLHIDEDAKLPDAGDTPDAAEPPEDPVPAGDPLADSETDKAVDDITAQEADLQLAVDDARARRRNEEAEAENQRGVFAVIFTSPWAWLIIIGIAGVVWAWYH